LPSPTGACARMAKRGLQLPPCPVQTARIRGGRRRFGGSGPPGSEGGWWPVKGSVRPTARPSRRPDRLPASAPDERAGPTRRAFCGAALCLRLGKFPGSLLSARGPGSVVRRSTPTAIATGDGEVHRARLIGHWRADLRRCTGRRHVTLARPHHGLPERYRANHACVTAREHAWSAPVVPRWPLASAMAAADGAVHAYNAITSGARTKSDQPPAPWPPTAQANSRLGDARRGRRRSGFRLRRRWNTGEGRKAPPLSRVSVPTMPTTSPGQSAW
jgi:hypothetical protein